MSENIVGPGAIVLLLALAAIAASSLSFVACRAFLRFASARRMHRLIVCPLLWMIPVTVFWLVPLVVMRDISDTLSLLLLIPAAAFSGFVYAGCFSLLGRKGKASAGWKQRILVGACLGALLALLAGVLLHMLLTGWGGPGGGSFHRPEVLLGVALFSWLIPLFAAAGVATPQRALVSEAGR